MKRVKMTIGAAIAVCAFGATAVPALATPKPDPARFVSSGGETRGKGGEQKLRLGPFKITCESLTNGYGVVTVGAAEAGESKEITSLNTFKGCTTAAKLGTNEIKLPTKFKTKVAVDYFSNGFVQVGSELEEEGAVTLVSGSVEIGVRPLKCVITWPEQTIPVKAENPKYVENEFPDVGYSNESYVKSGKTYTRLVIANSITHIHFEYGEGQCSEFKKGEEELGIGKWEGNITEEMKKPGILAWKATPESEI